jgi:hypothetical protein
MSTSAGNVDKLLSGISGESHIKTMEQCQTQSRFILPIDIVSPTAQVVGSMATAPDAISITEEEREEG